MQEGFQNKESEDDKKIRELTDILIKENPGAYKKYKEQQRRDVLKKFSDKTKADNEGDKCMRDAYILQQCIEKTPKDKCKIEGVSNDKIKSYMDAKDMRCYYNINSGLTADDEIENQDNPFHLV